jgi:hypothetical protein
MKHPLVHVIEIEIVPDDGGRHDYFMPRTRKSWRDKLADDKDLPKVARIEGKLKKRWGEGTFVIPAPREVDALMKRVPKRKLTTIDELRKALAKKHHADIACPITTGIFAWIAAHAAGEAAAAGRKRITPYWRTLKSNGEINPKYPGGLDKIAERLRSEGHQVIFKGRRAFVDRFSPKLVRFT